VQGEPLSLVCSPSVFSSLDDDDDVVLDDVLDDDLDDESCGSSGITGKEFFFALPGSSDLPKS